MSDAMGGTKTPAPVLPLQDSLVMWPGPAPSSPVGLIQVTFYPTSLLAVCLSMVPLPHSLPVFPGESSETTTFIWPEMPCPYLWKSGPQPAEAFKGLWMSSPVLLSSVICLCQGHFLWGVNGRWQEAQRHGHSQRSLLETLSLKVYSETFYSNIFPCRSEGIWRVLWRAGSIMGRSTAGNVLGRSGPRAQWEKSGRLWPHGNMLYLPNKPPDVTVSPALFAWLGEKRIKCTNSRLCFTCLNES